MKIALLLTILCLLASLPKSKKQNMTQVCREDVQSFKGIMAIAIVWVHFSIFSPYQIPFSGYFAAMGTPIVGMFLFLSGYGLMKSWSIRGVAFWQTYLSRRFLRLLPPVIIATGVYQFICWCKGEFSIDVIVEELCRGGMPLPFSWFIYEIALIYLLFFLSGQYIANRWKATFLMAVFIVILYCILKNLSEWMYVWYVTLLHSFNILPIISNAASLFLYVFVGSVFSSYVLHIVCRRLLMNSKGR